ncbi:MAG: hypothetical protein AB4372_15425 [Xenococcus sp. (in: cyanobacteria)]
MSKKNLGSNKSQSKNFFKDFFIFMIFDYCIGVILALALFLSYKYGIYLDRDLRVANFSSLLVIGFGLTATTFVFNINPFLQENLHKLSLFVDDTRKKQHIRDGVKKRLNSLRFATIILRFLSFSSALGSLAFLFWSGLDPDGFVIPSQNLLLFIIWICISLPLYFFRFYYRFSTIPDYLEAIDS